jgi:hypothetical protein
MSNLSALLNWLKICCNLKNSFLKQLLKKHFINSRGKSVKVKIIVIESDDWGSIRIPNKEVQSQLAQEGLIHLKDPFAAYDCLESAADYHGLYAVLSQFKDQNGRHPVLTANMVMGNPDFDKIKSGSFQAFYWEHFYKTYDTYYPAQQTYATLQDGISKSYIFPQFHAREHLNAMQWMKRLKDNDKRFLRAFELKCFAIDDINKCNQRANLMASYDYQSAEELAYLESSIAAGLEFFNDTFGFPSKTTIAPCYVWNQEIERIFNTHQVQAMQSSYVQQYNDASTSIHKRIWQKSGATNDLGQRYWVRNVLFEPSLNTQIHWVEKALESISVAFFWNKPAIIGSHRINYVGGLSLENRENSLKQLQQLLEAVLNKWPDIKFMNSAELNQYYQGG